jgi:superfamily II DNA helicase RecQ
LKLCPGALPNNSYQTLLLRPNPAIPLPKLQFGDIIRISGARELQSQRGKVVLELPEGNLPGSGDRRCEVDNLTPTTATHPHDGFLPDYTERTRWAIDELAYRFFGFEKMHDFQHDVLKRVLCGHSIFAIAATGGGKSECFILPALLLPGITIVVAPLKSLMQDQYEQRLRDRYGFGDIATYINGDLSFEEKQRRLMRMEKGYYKIVYFTPEQLERDYVLSFLRRAHENVGIRYIALDEAHCISQWGHDFRPSYLNIVLRLKNAGIHPLPVRIALTATASPKVREDVCRELELSSQSIDDGGNLYVHSSNRPELNFVVRIYDTTDQKVDEHD